MDTNKMREQFERAWLLMAYPGGDPDQTRSYGDLTLDVHDSYIDPIIHYAWWAWQASLEAVVVELPGAEGYGFSEDAAQAMRDECANAIEAQGLKVSP